jgi:hypothetical protein
MVDKKKLLWQPKYVYNCCTSTGSKSTNSLALKTEASVKKCGWIGLSLYYFLMLGREGVTLGTNKEKNTGLF